MKPSLRRGFASTFLTGLVWALAGCAAPDMRPPGGTPSVQRVDARAADAGTGTAGNAPLPPSEQALESGIKSYEDGAYGVAARQLRSALSGGLAGSSDRANAHKYLAFIHCVSGRPTLCRDEFRKALAALPSFDLTASEAGHPIWGPVFRAVKANHVSVRNGALMA